MISSCMRFLAAACAVFSAVAIGAAAEPPIIAKARAFIGSEAALQGLSSIHFTGTVTISDANDPAKKSSAAIELFFQKPEQQRVVMKGEKAVEITALDGYEGWTRIESLEDPSKWRQTLLGAEQIKRLRAQTFENLAFFRGLERRGGRVEDQGPVTIDGVACQKIAFIHAPNIIFYRHFDLATGRLVYTETEAGQMIREQGEMTVNGIRFPRALAQQAKSGPSQAQVVTITFDQIALNDKFPPESFAVPRLGASPAK